MDADTVHDLTCPIAIVGMAGRFPGAPDAESLWRLLMNGDSAIGPVPADRWDAAQPLDPDRRIQAVGGFIDGVDRFDAAFFGVSPREAADIDPQQRLLLETGWRTLEDAGVRASDLAGSRTGVYVGASWHDYELLRGRWGAHATPHSLVGNALDVIAARLSYFLRLRGPSMTVETGCSSSLVALHLAAQALRQGEIDAAIVGGVNLMLDPHVTVGLTHFGALSPQGRCAAFAAGADGFVRGEGVAALYVKTLDRALADGDRVHGVVVRTVVNNDGGGDSLVTPSPEGQEDLLRQAYRQGVVPAYIEAHGTGTGRGDPIEATAIGRVLGAGRTGDPVHIGSVKTNIGHLEACAGMAGLFKLLLALRHRVVPPSLHAGTLNPGIDFEGLGVRVAREPLALAPDGPVHLGVSSFGWGGTNAHVVVSSPPPPGTHPEATPAGAVPTGLPAVVPLSAKDSGALAELAGRMTSFVPEGVTESEEVTGIAELAGRLAHRRDHFPVRAACVAPDAGRLRAALETLAADPESGVTGRAVERGRVAFVFPGQGSQWSGMGRSLYRESPLFAAVVDRCAEALRPHVSWDPRGVFSGSGGEEWTTRIDMLQPTLWAMSLGLAELWRACGVEPDVVLGHSQGEITAATVAGILSYEDAALVMARRSAIARRASGRGRMLAVDLSREEAVEALAGFEDSVSLAVHNGPRSCVLSGEQEAVLTLKEILEAEGTYCRLVNVDYASHSPQMDPLREDLLTALAPVRPREGRVAMLSTVRGRRVEGAELDAAYWTDNLRDPVLFADAMNALLEDGVTHVVEISPHPVLAPVINPVIAPETATGTGAGDRPIAVLTTLRRDAGGTGDFAAALARAYVAGLEPFAELPRNGFRPLPGHPLRADRHWVAGGTASGPAARGLDVRLGPAPGERGAWHGALELSARAVPWLGDHKVYGTAVLPGAAILGAAVATARARAGRPPLAARNAAATESSLTLENVVFHKEVALDDERPARLTAEWRDHPRGGAFRLLSLPEGADEWTVNAVAEAAADPGPLPVPGFPEWHAGVEPTGVSSFYQECGDRGLDYGPAFQGVRTLYLDPAGGRALGRVVLAERLSGSSRAGSPLHPALWDGCLQVALTLYGGADALVPTAVRRVRVLADPDQPVAACWSHAVRDGDDRVDVFVFGERHEPLLTVEGLEMRPLPGTAAVTADTARLHHVGWTEVPPPAGTPAEPGRWAVYGGATPATDRLVAALTAALTAAGARVTDEAAAADAVLFVAPGADAGHEAQIEGLNRLTGIVRECVTAGASPRLTVVTTLAQGIGTTAPPDPGAALYWGYTRVLRREHPELEPRLVDVDPADIDSAHTDPADSAGSDWTGSGWAARCAAELLGPDAEDQIVLRGSTRLAARITRGEPEPDPTLPAPRTRPQPFRAEGRDHVPLERRPPEDGEIEIEVTAAPSTGNAVAGRVVATGPARGARMDGEDRPDGEDRADRVNRGDQVNRGDWVDPGDWGDRVVALAAGPPASHVVVRAEHARTIPDALTDAEAAGIALPAAVAWHALTEIGRVQPGQTVLVLSGDGALGQAAVRLALRLGARVVTAAPGPAPHEHDRIDPHPTDSHPAEAPQIEAPRIDPLPTDPHPTDPHPADPQRIDLRDPSWPDAVRRVTGGRGADVVVDCLGGSTLPAGLGALARGGRFVDVRGPGGEPYQRVDLGLFREGVIYAVVDPAELAGRAPETLARVWDLVTADELGPLPIGTRPFAHPPEDGDEAVLTAPETVGRVACVPLPGGRFRADGTYLVTGGMGALGLSLAEFLAENGAGCLVLLGRSEPGPGPARRVAALRDGGTRVRTVVCDVADRAALCAALDDVRRDLPPLRGVFHAAGVLADTTVTRMTPRHLADTTRPKVDGARNLDAATEHDPLDLFVLFSSAAALVGTAGQAAYAAANSFLDALAESRRRRGLPGLSVQWGPFTEVGLAAGDARRGARLADLGMGGFPTSEAWPALVRMLDGGAAVQGYVELEPRRWFDAYPATAALGSWRHLREAARDPGAGQGGEFRARLSELPEQARLALVETKIRELAGRVLRLAPEHIESEVPFKGLGLDSLMSLELRNRLESAFGLRLSPTLLWAHTNSKALSRALCHQLSPAANSA
ncbi:type I polyketide synthase [Microbispora sp. H10670]|uniref:type I polyketide synthase n=1 Tax=Microbispora sp. H10670 TaxID=2729108 RepID=UPI0015FFB09A|nr:type I polyketide synthase [Microbispora sp. H10670]